MPLRSLLCVAALWLGGCYSFSTLGRARIVEPGRVQVYGAAEALAVAAHAGTSIRPTGEVGVRVGVTRELELGARLTFVGLTGSARVQLLRASETRGLNVLIAPGLAYTAMDRLALELPLAVGVEIGEHEIVLAPRLVYQARLGMPTDAFVSFVYVGGSVGVVLQLDDHVAVVTEAAALGPLYADPGYGSNLADAIGLQLALGLLVDP